MNLIELRKSERYNRREVAQRIGIHENTLKMYENGSWNVHYITMIELAKIYDVPMATVEKAVLQTYNERSK